MLEADITKDFLDSFLIYEPLSGILSYKISTARSIRPGDVAGSEHHTGYVTLKIKGKKYQAHRLIWLMVHGELPKQFIDHINGCRADNRLINLRIATRSQNAHNSCVNINSPLGIKGLTYNAYYNRYDARIACAGVTYQKTISVHSSNFTEDEIINTLSIWLQETRQQLHKEFANHG